jgi:hypothetical protein
MGISGRLGACTNCDEKGETFRSELSSETPAFNTSKLPAASPGVGGRAAPNPRGAALHLIAAPMFLS